MNYNPFAQNAVVNDQLHHPKAINLFDRTVGRPEQMGLFDYLLVLPFFIKLGLHIAFTNRNIPLTVIFIILSTPFHITKLCIYAATSPLIFLTWLLKESIKLQQLKHLISPYTSELNRLTVTTPTDAMPKCLAEVNKLHDVDLDKYSIKLTNEKLMLTKFPNRVVAIIEPSRKNLLILLGLLNPEHLDHNRVMYFLTNVGTNIIDFSAKEKIKKINTQDAFNHVNLLHKILTHCKRDDTNASTSLAIIPKDVRKIIAKMTLEMETSEELNGGIFRTFSKEERQIAFSDYVNNPRLYGHSLN